jgi:hypothetical protein
MTEGHASRISGADQPGFVRFRSRFPDTRGAFIGVFGLVNVLGRHGMLAPAEERFRRESNAWYDAAYPDPYAVLPSLADRPLAASWFRVSATTLLDRVPGYLAILDHHAIAWERVETDAPGEVLYEDDQQVVADVPTESRSAAGTSTTRRAAPRSPGR